VVKTGHFYAKHVDSSIESGANAGIDVLEMKEKEACFFRRIAHSLAVMIECAAIGRVLTHLSSASDVVRMFGRASR
jgi:hypothetical protein